MQSAHLRPGSTIVVMDDWVVQDRIFTNVLECVFSEVAPALVPLHTRLRCLTRRG